MDTQPNYHHLFHFWIVAQEGSLLGASRRLGVRHSTLSAQMRALEKSLGTMLLDRRSRGVRLTPQAEVVRSYCDQIFRLGAELVDAAREKRSNRLRVVTLPSVPRTLLYDAVRPALDGESGGHLELSVTSAASACQALVEGRADVVIADRVPAAAFGVNIHAHLVGETGVGIFGTRRLAERFGRQFPKSLDGAPILLPEPGSPLREALMGWFADEGVRPRVVGEFDDQPLLRGFGGKGHGLVPIRLALAHEAREHYGLVPVGEVPGVVDRVYALTLGRRLRHVGVQKLVEQCRSALRRGGDSAG